MRTVSPNDQLRALRMKRGFSRKDLAQQVGVSHFTIGRWERGEISPAPFQLARLCQIFDCAPQELGFLEVNNADAATADPMHIPLSHFDPAAPVDEGLPAYKVCIDPTIPLRVSPALVGRAELQATLRSRLCMNLPKAVIALHGLPGMGKTALASTIAHDEVVRAYFTDGVLWAGLGPRPNLLLLLSRWGALLGLTMQEMSQLTGIEAWSKALRTAIGGRKMLIVIDDAWQLEEVLACKIGGEQCRHLVTTRFPVLGAQLAVDDVTQLQELNEQESLTLIDTLAPGVIAADEQMGLELVRAVSGLPLALTLIGNYLRSQQMAGEAQRVPVALRRLNDIAVRLNISEPNHSLTRHPSLDPDTPLSLLSIIEVTDQLLADAVRTVFYVLSLLPAKPDSFAEEMALALADCSADALDQLIDAGLLECTFGDRYYLHQVIADYARLHLSDEEKGRASMRLIRHVSEYLRLHQKDYELLDRESSTILTALELAYTLEQRAELIEIVCTFAPFLILRGLYGQADLHLQRAYEATMDDDAERARVLLYQGEMALKQSNFAQAEETLQASLQLAQKAGAEECTCDALTNLGAMAWRLGEYAHAEDLLQQGLVIARRLESVERMERIMKNLGSVFMNRGDIVRGSAILREGLELARQVGDREQICVMLGNIGAQLGEQGDYDQAEMFFREGLALARQIGHREQTCVLLINLGNLMKEKSDYEQARAYFYEGLQLARQIRYPEWISVLLCDIGSISLTQGDAEAAEHYLHESLAVARQVGRKHTLCNALQEYGYFYLALGHYQLAEEHFREMLDIVPSGDQQWQAFAYYGLAQVAAAQNRFEDAHHDGALSVQALELINHSRARPIREWLNELPQE